MKGMNEALSVNRKSQLTKFINTTAGIMELIISLVITFGVVVFLINLIIQYFHWPWLSNNFDFNGLLEQSLTLVIGIEFTRMLWRHTPEAVIEVLLFATARQLIVGHPTVIDSLIGILAIAILFIVRKYVVHQEKNAPSRSLSRLFGRPKEPAERED